MACKGFSYYCYYCAISLGSIFLDFLSENKQSYLHLLDNLFDTDWFLFVTLASIKVDPHTTKGIHGVSKTHLKIKVYYVFIRNVTDDKEIQGFRSSKD